MNASCFPATLFIRFAPVIEWHILATASGRSRLRLWSQAASYQTQYKNEKPHSADFRLPREKIKAHNQCYCFGSRFMDYDPFAFSVKQQRTRKHYYAMASLKPEKIISLMRPGGERRPATTSEATIMKYRTKNDLIDITCMINWVVAVRRSKHTVQRTRSLYRKKNINQNSVRLKGHQNSRESIFFYLYLEVFAVIHSVPTIRSRKRMRCASLAAPWYGIVWMDYSLLALSVLIGYA